MKNKSYIDSVRVNSEIILIQYIDTETDEVCFIGEHVDVIRFLINHSGYTTYVNDKLEIINIGKFGYRHGTDCKFIDFTFDKHFVIDNPQLTVDHPELTEIIVQTTSGDFIRAEQLVIKHLLLVYPEIFKV
jgi:hypothetical protein